VWEEAWEKNGLFYSGYTKNAAEVKGEAIMLQAFAEKSRRIVRVERMDDRLYLYAEAGIYCLEPKAKGIIRVTYTQDGVTNRQAKPGVIYNRVDGDWTYEERDEQIFLRMKKICLIIHRETAEITYWNEDGTKLLETYDPTMEEFTTYRILEEDLQVEKVSTADGVKDVVREAVKVPMGKSYHTRIHCRFGEEALYGLGQHEEGFGSLRGQTVYLHQANRKIAIPMLVSTKGYGILMDTYSPMIFSDSIYGTYLYTEADSSIDFYVLAGCSMEEVIQGYRLLTGKAAMLPKWAFGYIQSQERYETQEEILQVAEEYRRRNLGLDCVVLDWCSWEGNQWGQKSLDRKRFPKPSEMIEALHNEYQVHFMLSIWPNMEECTNNYKEFKENKELLPGCNIYNALSRKGRDIYWEQVSRELFIHGIDAWWCDNSEPFTPEWNHRERMEPGKMYEEYCKTAELHLPAEETNAYGLYHAMGIYEGQRKENSEKRVVNLTRSAYTGQQRYGTIMWSGDINATWETLRKQIAAGLHFSASGLPYWTVDVGAFFVKRGNMWYWKGDYDKTNEDLGFRELFVRWFQWAAFLPVFRGHGTDCRRELWQIENTDVPFYDALVAANRLRYELMPYIYSLAGQCYLEDASMMMPLAFAYQKDKKTWSIMDQYLFGPSLMVCPVTEPMYYKSGSVKLSGVDRVRKVYLPEGNGWYDFYTNTYYQGGQWIITEATIERMPLFVKEGAILPKIEFARSTKLLGSQLQIFFYEGADGSFTLYEDEDDGYGYEEGRHCVTRLAWERQKQKLTVKREVNKYKKENGYRIKAVTLVKKEGTIQEVKEYEETGI